MHCSLYPQEEAGGGLTVMFQTWLLAEMPVTVAWYQGFCVKL